MSRRLVLGIGTGRCGTKSLVRLLNAQPSSAFTHEATPTLPWEPDFEAFRKKMAGIMERSAGLVGDVGFYYLPYVAELLEAHPQARVICLQRDRESTVQSFISWTAGTHRWLSGNGGGYKRDGWDRCYPKYEITDRTAACGRYWDEYYARVEELVSESGDRVRTWEMERALNTPEGKGELLSFAGFPEEGRNLEAQFHENKSKKRPEVAG